DHAPAPLNQRTDGGRTIIHVSVQVNVSEDPRRKYDGPPLAQRSVGDAHPIARLRVLDARRGHWCHSTAQISCFPDRPFSSTVLCSPQETSDPSTNAFRTLDARISPPWAWEATRAAMITLRPKKSSPSLMTSPAWSPMRTRTVSPFPVSPFPFRSASAF